MGKAGAYTACAVLARYGYGARLEAAVMAFTDARNDKPPCGGLTGLGDKPYSRDVSRGKAKITAGERSCQPSFPSLLGNSGRGNNAQSDLKPTPGRPACRCAAYRREAQMAAGKPVKSSRQRMAPSVINSARSRVRRNPSKTPCGITISHQGL